MPQPQWPADKVERRPIASLVPYARNARTHSPDQVKQIAASIEEWGWTVPVLLDEAGGIIAGHGRVLAAKLIGLADIPCMIAEGWSQAQKQAYVIADNKLALGAGWDDQILKLELGNLQLVGFNIELTGFSLAEFGEIGAIDLPGGGQSGAGNLAERFGIPPFSVFNAREGWWQDRKNAWLALGIQSELGRGEQANDRGESSSARINDAADGQERYKGRKANATPGGSKQPAIDKKTGKIVRADSKGRPLPAGVK